MQKLSACLLVSVLSKGSLAAQCSVADAQALGSIDEAQMQACMGTSTDVSKLQSCLLSSGVSLSSGCVNCLSTVATAAQDCGVTCAADPQAQPCQDCVAQLSNSALQCFGSDISGFTTSNPSGQSGETSTASTTKSAVVPSFAAAAGIVALALLS